MASDTLWAEENPSEPSAEFARCQAFNRKGAQCDREAVEGGVVCVLHGASMMVAKETIQRRLLALQEKSVRVLEEILACADDKTRLAAATTVMDRTGLGPKSTVTIDTAPDLQAMNSDQLTAELERLTAVSREQEKRERMHEALMLPNSASNIRH